MADKEFELGLVMAGAISAGAYTAGVMDFLFEALDEYDALRKTSNWDGPATPSASPSWPAPPRAA